MSIGSELEKLNQLHKDGILSDIEFATAKSKLLSCLGPENSVGSGVHLIGKAAYKFVNFKIVATVVGVVVFTLFFFTFFLPRFQKMEEQHDKFNQQIESDMQKNRERMEKMTQDFDKDYESTNKQIEQTRKEIEDTHKRMGLK